MSPRNATCHRSAPGRGCTGAQRSDVVTDEDDRFPVLHHLADPRQALCLGNARSPTANLVSKGSRGRGGPQPKMPAGCTSARIALDRNVDEVTHARELDDLVESLPRYPCGSFRGSRRSEHVVAAAELRMKPGSDLQQAAHAAAQLGVALGRIRDACQNREQRRFPGAVRPDDPEYFAAPNVKADIAQGPDLASQRRVACISTPSMESQAHTVAEALRTRLRPDAVLLPQPVRGDDDVVHRARGRPRACARVSRNEVSLRQGMQRRSSPTPLKARVAGASRAAPSETPG